MSSKRGIYHNFLSHDACQQLLFIHRSLGVVGYRPHVRSTTLFDLVLSEPRLLPVLVHVRQQVLDAVEEHFDKPCQVFVEHTGLISWSAGASIGWHHDSNREYLSQRHFSAVLYLSTQGVDFTGGTFCFQSGRPPLHIHPVAGTLLMYTADASNVHQVQPVSSGWRAALTMWFTLDEAHQEDKKVLASLSSTAMCAAGLPATMYQQTPDTGDIRLTELQRLGVQLVCQTQDYQTSSTSQQQQQRQRERKPQQQQQQQQEKQEEHQTDKQSESAWLLLSGDGTSPVMQFDSIQDAASTLYMLQWKLCHHKQQRCGQPTTSGPAIIDADGNDTVSAADTAPLQQRCCKLQRQQHWQQQPDHHVCECYTDCKQLARARQLLQEYIHAAGETFEQLLPVWLKLGALVAPQPANEHHQVPLG